jgi:acetyl esterase/lipase
MGLREGQVLDRRSLLRRGGGLLASVCGLGAATRGRGAEQEVTVRKDVVYFEGPAEEQKRHQLDVYLPAGKSGFPLLMFVHGGAWRSGVKDLYGPLGTAFARQGVGVVVPNYRLSPGVRHPEHVRDVARAFAWAAGHAKELGADPARLYVSGHSAGGHLVALLALDPRYLKEQSVAPETVKGVIGISGPYLLGPRLFPEVFGDDPPARADAFPLNHVQDRAGASLPPFLLLAADMDYPGLLPSARGLEAALVKQGASATLREITGRDHITIISKAAQPDDPTAKAILEFIKP